VPGSPVYFSDLPPELKALVDRVGFASQNAENPWRRKAGAAAARRAGHVHRIPRFFGITEMIL
jgi:multimeric flavodoxin WrbA